MAPQGGKSQELGEEPSLEWEEQCWGGPCQELGGRSAAMGWAVQTQHKTFLGPHSLLSEGPQEGPGWAWPCNTPIQPRMLLCFLELAYLHTSYNYHLHSQRHLLEMG